MNISKNNRGFTLVEVLVALLILSVGMLGVLTLQVKSLQFSHSAQINTNVINAAADIADRIRANALGLAAYNDISGDAAGAQPPGPLCSDTVDGAATGTCTVEEIAAYDLWQWKRQLQASRGIPGGSGKVLYEAPDPAAARMHSTYTIDIDWNERGENRTYQIVINN